MIQGIGGGFIPGNLDTSLLNDVVRVSNDDAFACSRRVSKREGILGGISTGANVWAALELARRPEFRGKRIVTVAASSAERYLSTALFEHR
jgi:cysteine synthase A